VRKKIDKNRLWVSDEKGIEFEIKIEMEYPEDMLDDMGFEDYTTYQTFKSLLDMFEWVAENIDYIRKAKDCGYSISLVIRSRDSSGNYKDWCFDIEDEGMMRFSVNIGNLLSEKERRLEEALEKIESIVRDALYK